MPLPLALQSYQRDHFPLSKCMYNHALFFVFPLSKYLPKHKLPENVIATTDAKSALLGADYCLHAVPVQVFHFPCFCW